MRMRRIWVGMNVLAPLGPQAERDTREEKDERREEKDESLRSGIREKRKTREKDTTRAEEMRKGRREDR